MALRIIVLGYVVGFPLGGMTWHSLQYVLGLHRLGHDVWFLEDSNDWENCYDPTTGEVSCDPAYGLAYARRVFGHYGLDDRWAYFEAGAERWHGPAAPSVAGVCTTADVLINVAGIHPIRPWLGAIPHRIFVDADPGFTQIRHLTDPSWRAHAENHTAFATFGENIPLKVSHVPDDGFAWYRTRQPVVLDAWAVSPLPERPSFTTVMQWDSYPPVEYEGVSYGMKSASFGPFVGLPSMVDARLELAVGRMLSGRDALSARGWHITSSQEATWDPWRYQQYIAASTAEFSVAKHGYVTGWTGWFSERTACYLASGRPAVVQDTGFTEVLPSALGVLPFRTAEEAAEAIREVTGNAEAHATAARDFAAEHFDSGRVLSELIENAG